MRPNTSGRTPILSRTPINWVAVSATREYAPSTWRRASIMRSTTVVLRLVAMRWIMTSVSMVDWKMQPRRTRDLRTE